MPCEKECAEKTDVSAEDMIEAIKANFEPTHFEVEDGGTCGTSYNVIIVSVIMYSLHNRHFTNIKINRPCSRD